METRWTPAARSRPHAIAMPMLTRGRAALDSTVKEEAAPSPAAKDELIGNLKVSRVLLQSSDQREDETFLSHLFSGRLPVPSWRAAEASLRRPARGQHSASRDCDPEKPRAHILPTACERKTQDLAQTPAEKSLVVHLLWLRELLDIGQIHAIVWTDTRDMAADGMTNGAVDRRALHEVMGGDGSSDRNQLFGDRQS